MRADRLRKEGSDEVLKIQSISRTARFIICGVSFAFLVTLVCVWIGMTKSALTYYERIGKRIDFDEFPLVLYHPHGTRAVIVGPDHSVRVILGVFNVTDTKHDCCSCLEVYDRYSKITLLTCRVIDRKVSIKDCIERTRAIRPKLHMWAGTFLFGGRPARIGTNGNERWIWFKLSDRRTIELSTSRPHDLAWRMALNTLKVK